MNARPKMSSFGAVVIFIGGFLLGMVTHAALVSGNPIDWLDEHLAVFLIFVVVGGFIFGGWRWRFSSKKEAPPPPPIIPSRN